MKFLGHWLRYCTTPNVAGFIQARFSKIQGLLKDKFIFFKAFFNNNTYTHFLDKFTFRTLLPIFVTSVSFLHTTI